MPPDPSRSQILFQERTHMKILVPTAIIQGLLLAAHYAIYRWWPSGLLPEAANEWGPMIVHGIILFIELVYVVVPLLRWWHSTFTVTTDRIVMNWGILNKHAREIPINRITQVNVERDLIDRLFGCGTIVLFDAGSIDSVKLDDVPHVHQVRRILDELRYPQQQ